MQIKFFLANYEEILQRTKSQKILYVIILISIVAFSPVFTNSSFLTFDDNWYIYENSNVTDLSLDSIKDMFGSPKQGQYSPLAELYHSILYQIFGKNARAFKIFAFFVHLLNVLLLFRIFSKLFVNKLFISVVVLFFAIHPVQVETIGWLSVIFRNAVVFMFLGYLFYIKYLENNFKKYLLVPVVACYFLAFLTKEQAILFPVGLFLINLIKFDSVYSKRIIVEMALWILVTLIMGFIIIEITETGGPSIVDRNVSLFNKFALLSKTISKYSLNFLFPTHLSFSYPYPTHKGFPGSWIYMLISAALLIIATYGSMKNKFIRFGLLWVLGFCSLAFAFAFFYLRQTYMADRYLYVGIIGLAVLFYQFLLYLKRNKFINKSVFFITILSFSMFFVILTFQRIKVFKTNQSVWAQALQIDPNNYVANHHLGNYYLKLDNPDTAISLYKKALKVNPKFSLTHSNITKAYYDKKQYDSALFHVSKAIAISPKYIAAYKNRSAVHLAMGKRDLYLQDLNTLIKLSPQNGEHRLNRAKYYFKEKQYKKSLDDVLVLIKEKKQNDSETFFLAGNNLLLLSKFKEAEFMFSKAIQLNSEKGKHFYMRSITRVKSKEWILALKDVVKAKEKGYKVSDDYFNMLVREVKKNKR